MKTLRYSDSQIMAIFKQAGANTPAPELCHEHGMSSASFYKWQAKYRRVVQNDLLLILHHTL